MAGNSDCFLGRRLSSYGFGGVAAIRHPRRGDGRGPHADPYAVTDPLTQLSNLNLDADDGAGSI